MGQVESVPQQAAGAAAPAAAKKSTQRFQSPVVNTSVRPPDGWSADNNNAAFLLVSPCSDISNPSQFRHRQPPPGAAAAATGANTTAATAAQQQPPLTQELRSSRRASKVINKHTPARNVRLASSLPPPQRFYFATGQNETDSLSDHDNEVSGRRCVTTNRRWRAKYRKARRRTAQLLGNCAKKHLYQSDEGERARPGARGALPPVIVHRVTNQNNRMLLLQQQQQQHELFSDTTSAKQEEGQQRLPHRTSAPLVGWTVSAPRDSNATDQSTRPLSLATTAEERLAAAEQPYVQFLQAATTYHAVGEPGYNSDNQCEMLYHQHRDQRDPSHVDLYRRHVSDEEEEDEQQRLQLCDTQDSVIAVGDNDDDDELETSSCSSRKMTAPSGEKAPSFTPVWMETQPHDHVLAMDQDSACPVHLHDNHDHNNNTVPPRYLHHSPTNYMQRLADQSSGTGMDQHGNHYDNSTATTITPTVAPNSTINSSTRTASTANSNHDDRDTSSPVAVLFNQAVAINNKKLAKATTVEEQSQQQDQRQSARSSENGASNQPTKPHNRALSLSSEQQAQIQRRNSSHSSKFRVSSSSSEHQPTRRASSLSSKQQAQPHRRASSSSSEQQTQPHRRASSNSSDKHTNRRASSLTSKRNGRSSSLSSSQRQPVVATVIHKKSNKVVVFEVDQDDSTQVEKRRSMVQEEVQRQINDSFPKTAEPLKQEATGSRIARIRQQYQQELESLTTGSTMPSKPATAVPLSRRVGGSNPTTAPRDEQHHKQKEKSLHATTRPSNVINTSRNRKSEESGRSRSLSHGRSSSLEMAKNRRSSSTSNARSRRSSISSRPSNTELPALLLLTTSAATNKVAVNKVETNKEAAKPTEQRTRLSLAGFSYSTMMEKTKKMATTSTSRHAPTELPALLHIAGWKTTTSTAIPGAATNGNKTCTALPETKTSNAVIAETKTSRQTDLGAASSRALVPFKAERPVVVPGRVKMQVEKLCAEPPVAKFKKPQVDPNRVNSEIAKKPGAEQAAAKFKKQQASSSNGKTREDDKPGTAQAAAKFKKPQASSNHGKTKKDDKLGSDQAVVKYKTQQSRSSNGKTIEDDKPREEQAVAKYKKQHAVKLQEGKPNQSDNSRRHSDPLDMVSRNGKNEESVTTASILKQTYSFSESFAKKRQKDIRRSSSYSVPADLDTKNYREIALSRQSMSSNTVGILVSPNSSMQSSSTTGSSPMVSTQALSNAAFMFSPSYVGAGPDLLLTAPTRSSTEEMSSSFTISTLESRNRVTVSAEPVQIRASTSLGSDSRQVERRVRFSDANSYMAFETLPYMSNRDNKKKTLTYPSEAVEVPALESKLSDLTDTGGYGTAGGPRESIQSIPEESIDLARVSAESSLSDNEETSLSASKPSSMQWAYSSGMDTGVTPLRSGKSTANATNSPYVRFQQARTKFTGPTKAAVKKEKDVPVKKKLSPVKKRPVGGLVHTRIAAMEANRGGDNKTDSSVVPSGVVRKARRDTNGHRVIAPKKATLASSVLRTPPMSARRDENEESSPFDESMMMSVPDSPYDEVASTAVKTSVMNSPILLRTGAVSSPARHSPDMVVANEESTTESRTESRLSSDFTPKDDAFGEIMHPTTLDEDTDEEDHRGALNGLLDTYRAVIENNEFTSGDEDSSDDDDFADLLRHQSSYDTTGSSMDEETVDTIRQDKSGKLGVQFSSYRLSVGGQSTSSNTTGVSTVTTVRQQRESVSSATQASKSYSNFVGRAQPRLPFREEAPVKPNELNHRIAPGGLQSSSPMMRTPMQARTWRVLAAAAQERDSQRNLVNASNNNSDKNIVAKGAIGGASKLALQRNVNGARC